MKITQPSRATLAVGSALVAASLLFSSTVREKISGLLGRGPTMTQEERLEQWISHMNERLQPEGLVLIPAQKIEAYRRAHKYLVDNGEKISSTIKTTFTKKWNRDTEIDNIRKEIGDFLIHEPQVRDFIKDRTLMVQGYMTLDDEGRYTIIIEIYSPLDEENGIEIEIPILPGADLI